MEEFIADLRMPNQEYQARRRNHEHKRIRLIEVNERIHQRLNHSLCLNPRSQRKMDLLPQDNQTNGRKNPMDDAGMKNIGKTPQLQQTQHHLKRAADDDGSKHKVDVSKRGNASQNDRNETCRRTIDGQVTSTIESRHHPSYDGRDDACNGFNIRRYSNT